VFWALRTAASALSTDPSAWATLASRLSVLVVVVPPEVPEDPVDEDPVEPEVRLEDPEGADVVVVLVVRVGAVVRRGVVVVVVEVWVVVVRVRVGVRAGP